MTWHRIDTLGLAAALALLLGSGASQAQRVAGSQALDDMRGERRVALVVGNGSYGPEIGPLANPTNDAADMAKALETVGFEVTLRLDVDRDQMLRAMIDFGRTLRNGGVGLFYYAGHAVQLGGSNYLIPIGAEIDGDDYVPVETVEVDQVLARMGGADNRLNIVVLDACRNNPFRSQFRSFSRGLASTLAPTGTYIAYAAAPGQVARDGLGRNSPYTGALVELLGEPGLLLEEVFKQVRARVVSSTNGSQTPWTASSIIGDFYFRLPEPEETVPEVPAPEPGATPAPTATNPDVVVWSTIADSREPAVFEAFLEAYPDSALAPMARGMLARLQAPTPAAAAVEEPATPPLVGAETQEPSEMAALPPEPEPEAPPAPASIVDHAAIEQALGLSRDQRREIQFALRALGNDPGEIDGLLGRRSRAAIAGWQSAEGIEPTGHLTETQVTALLDTLGPAALDELRDRLRAEPAVGVSSQPGQVFRDCPECPEMVVIPAGSFTMGSPGSEISRDDDEGPQHRVTIAAPFAMGRHEVTFGQWDACVSAGGCPHRPDDEWGRDEMPVMRVSWKDAQGYLEWLSRRTGQHYRLPSEAEWEYAARAGTTTPFHTGTTISTDQANYDGNYIYGDGQKGVYRQQTVEVASFPANEFGLHDMHGNVWEWVEDCWNTKYRGAPSDGSARDSGDCSRRVLRGGSWRDGPRFLRSANHSRLNASYRNSLWGFRVARTLR